MLYIHINVTVKFTYLRDDLFCGMAPQLCNTEELCDVGRPVAVGTVALRVNVLRFSHIIQGHYFVRLLSLVISCHLT